MRETTDQPMVEGEACPRYPVTVMVAGVVWLAFGLLSLVAILLPIVIGQVPVGPVGLLGIVIGAVFTVAGVQCCWGTGRDTLGLGVASIVLGILELGCGLQLTREVLAAGVVAMVSGFVLMAAGVLALVGRAKYRLWRQAQKAQNAACLHC